MPELVLPSHIMALEQEVEAALDILLQRDVLPAT